MRGSVLILALVISAIVHMALLVVVARPYQRQTTSRELPSIELVPQNEAPAFNDDPMSPDQPQSQQQAQDKPKPAESLPDFSQLRMDKPVRPDDTQQQQKQAALPTPEQQKPQAQQQQQSQQQQQQQQQSQQQKPAQAMQGATPPQQQSAAPAEPPQSQAQQQPEQPLPEQPKMSPEMAVETPADQGNRLAALMNLPPVTPGENGFGSEADSKARLSADEIAQFKAHLRSCWKLPAGVPANAQVKVLIRLALRPNGTLADQPSLIEAAASEMGLPIYKSGVAALRQCAPYTMLPPEKYKEWRVLDVNFSPDQMGG
jgi:hypothetical protein